MLGSYLITELSVCSCVRCVGDAEEGKDVLTTVSLPSGLLFSAFALCMYGLYSCMPIVVKLSSATSVNLSLLTADLFSLFCGIFLFQYNVSRSTHMHAHTDIEVPRHLIYTSRDGRYCNICILSTHYWPYLNQENVYDNEFGYFTLIST